MDCSNEQHRPEDQAERRSVMRAMRKIMIALFAGTIIGFVPMFAEQAEAQRGGRGGGGIGRVGIGGGGIGRVGIGGGGFNRVGIGRAGWGGGRIAGVGWGGRGWGWAGRPGLARAAWYGGRPGLARAAWWGGRPGLARAAWWGGRPGWRRAAWWGGNPGWRFRRAAWWGAPLAFGAFAAYGGSCLRWDPYYGGYVNVCYSSYGWNGGYW
jgi:hypothetical protein